jgi:predicted RNA-binding Zn ribbon-like protein
MQDEAVVDQKASDAELIALVRRAQEELEAHGELNQVSLLLRDFARERLKQRATKSGVRANDRIESAGVEGTYDRRGGADSQI